MTYNRDMFVEEYLADLRRERFRPGAWIVYIRRSLALSREHAFHNPEALRSLGVTGIAGCVALLVCAVAISLSVNMGTALAFFRNTVVTLFCGLFGIAAHLKMLTDGHGRPLRRINPANILTLTRLVSIPAFLVFVKGGLTELALLTFVGGALTDVLDGWYARHRGDATALGRVFDPIVDILFNAAMMAALFDSGVIPAWVFGLVLLRYSLLVGGATALYIFRGPVEIKPTILGKATGVVTTVLVTVLVGGMLLLDGGVYDRIRPLLVIALGFVEAITVPQVILIGLYNYKRAGRSAATAALELVRIDRHGTR